MFILYLDCWNNEPDNRPTINQVAAKLNAIILKESIQLSSEQLFINNSFNEKMSQIIQNFSKINIKEIEPLMSSENDFDIMVNEIILFFEGVEMERRKHEITNYLNNYNVTSQEIYKWLLNSQDNSNYVFLLGVFYNFGIEVNVDKQKAFELYQNAANLGDTSGIISLGYCYEKGIGTGVNRKKAFELYQKAANLGNPRGIRNLGYCYFNGIGTTFDYQKAFKLFQKSTNLGNTLGIINLGYCFENGIGTNVDMQKAFELYQKAANLGYYLAQYNLALMYKNGKGIKKDINRAIYWYKKSAEQGYQDAQHELDELINL
jgi:TPR repeat protein